MIHWKHVKLFGEKLREGSIEVREREFVKSAHVGHFRFHREAYMEACRDFVLN